MRRFWISLLAFASLATGAFAQEVVDGTDGKVGKKVLADIFDAARTTMLDGYSAKFTELYQGENAVCGKVNGKNLYGAYTGAYRFMYTYDDKHLSILDPSGGEAMLNLRKQVFQLTGCPTW